MVHHIYKGLLSQGVSTLWFFISNEFLLPSDKEIRSQRAMYTQKIIKSGSGSDIRLCFLITTLCFYDALLEKTVCLRRRVFPL